MFKEDQGTAWEREEGEVKEGEGANACDGVGRMTRHCGHSKKQYSAVRRMKGTTAEKQLRGVAHEVKEGVCVKRNRAKKKEKWRSTQTVQESHGSGRVSIPRTNSRAYLRCSNESVL